MAETRRRRLILHVGQTKAGSTAIQNYLDSQRDALRAAGVLFPQTFFLRRNPVDAERTPGHLGLVKALAAGEDLSAFHEECAQSGCATVVLSIENLFQDQPDKMLAAIGKALSDWRVELVAVLRPFPDWLASRYIEEVMTGYRRGGMVLDAFTEEVAALGWHDYAGRLDVLTELIGAAQTHVINYDAARADGGVIPAFLAATGLPETDPALARNLQANVREKWWSMVEAARRMNCVLRDGGPVLKSAARRQLEGAFRTRAREIAEGCAELAGVTGADVSLSAGRCQQIDLSNRRLQTDYRLALPLSAPTPTRPNADQQLTFRQHRQNWPGADQLTIFGLSTAAKLSQKIATGAKSDQTPGGSTESLLAYPGISLVIELLAQSKISIHMDSPETAVWAACLNGRLPILLSERDLLPECLRLLSLRLPSEIVCLDSDISPVPILRKQRADLVLVPLGISIERACDIWRLAGSCAKVIVMDAQHDLADAIAENLKLEMVGLAGNIRVLEAGRAGA